MARGEEHLRELLRLPAKERVRAAQRLLDSVDEADLLPDEPNPFAEGTQQGPDVEESLGSVRGEMEPEDELTELDELAADQEGLRAAVCAAVAAELEPLHELTNLLRRFAEAARTTGHALHARGT